MNPHDSLEAAFVLHRRAYRESSLLVELLTASRGRVGAVARGARGARSRWRGILEPFQALLVGFAGRGELATLRHAETADRPPRLAGTSLASAFYMNELLLRVLRRDDACPEVFAAYAAGLQALTDGQGEARALRLLEMRLLHSLGYGLTLRRTAGGEAIRHHGWYRYIPGEGLEEVSTADPRCCPGSVILALADEESLADETVYLQAKCITGAAIAPLLGDRPLESRSLYRQQQRRSVRTEGPDELPS